MKALRYFSSWVFEGSWWDHDDINFNNNVIKYNVLTGHNVLIGNNSDIHANITTKSWYEHYSNFKCTNHDDNDDENVEFMFENVIKAHNMLIDVNDVPEFVPKANQGPLQCAPTAAGLCFCV